RPKMLATAIVLFLLAALGGIAMAVRIFRNARPPMPLALGHGALAAVALILALVAALAPAAAPLLKIGAAVLIVAALGGFFLFSFQLRGKPHPKAVVVLHALLAVGGVGCLALVVL
ncbi:MAG TPA: hypothetical protein VF213_04380, partial [Dongiaceae bacterium]